MLAHSVSFAAAPIITSVQDTRINLKLGEVELTVPIPAGYELIDHRRLSLTPLPVIQERSMIAAFKQAIDASNVYQVAPDQELSAPLYYLVYVPKLDRAVGNSADLLSQLETRYFEQGAELVGESQRYALQRTGENTLSVTWVDLSQYAVPVDAGLSPGSANCINTIAYRKATALVMFDTIEACGLNAARVKNHGEAWAQRIRSLNEPPSFAQRILAERGDEDAALADAEPEADSSADEVEGVDKSETGLDVASGETSLHPVLVLLLGAALGISLWLLFGYVRRRLEN